MIVLVHLSIQVFSDSSTSYLFVEHKMFWFYYSCFISKEKEQKFNKSNKSKQLRKTEDNLKFINVSVNEHSMTTWW